MGIKKLADDRWRVTKFWPRGKPRQLKRIVRTRKMAGDLLKLIEGSIVRGDWEELREKLVRGDRAEHLTIAEASDLYMSEYVITRNSDVAFKKHKLAALTEHLGKVDLNELTRNHVYSFITAYRQGRQPATVNRALAVLKSMLHHMVDTGRLKDNPLAGFSLLKEEQTALRVMTYEEYRHLADCCHPVSPTLAAFVAVLGETALRKAEGLRLQWKDIGRESLTVAKSKSKKPRTVPLTPFARAALDSLQRIVGVPWVFLKSNKAPYRDIREVFDVARIKAGLSWVGFHDLRHFRATQWVRMGIDIVTVQALLGHSDIKTTQRYAHFVQAHAVDEVRRVAELESGRKLDDPNSATAEAV